MAKSASLNPLPPEICEQCRAEAPDHWLTALWYYCPHNRIMCVWNRHASTWRIDRKVKPKYALKYLAAAMKKMAAWVKAQGLSMKEADAMLTKLREFDKGDAGPNQHREEK